MNALLAFYIGKGNYIDKAIRLWTSSNYSHVELIYDNYWYSISPRLQTVSKRVIVPNSSNWEYIEVQIDEEYLLNFYNNTKHCTYDWLGIILTQFIPIGIDSSKKWFCSEWCATALQLKKTHKLSPEDLYLLVKA